MSDAAIDAVRAYHERTKHHLDRYARSLGYLDWANQPDPFRRYDGVPVARLRLPDEEGGPSYDGLYQAPPPPQPLDAGWVSRLLYYSLALSAWKRIRDRYGRVLDRWSLRVNPSSGNLHPTEAYLIAGPVPGLSEEGGVWHYAPEIHGLEQLRTIRPGPPPECVLLGLTSIHWREAWKYGERAFRYSQLDLGHAIGAVALAARSLGWTARLDDSVSTRTLAALLGIDRQQGVEAERAGCLLVLTPRGHSGSGWDAAAIAGSAWCGEPNRLSLDHHHWPVIDEVDEATESGGLLQPQPPASGPALRLSDRRLPAWNIIRRRRSAVAMDGVTHISRDAFFRMLLRVVPEATPAPYDTLPWRPSVSLLVFVHRVESLERGLYALVRDPAHEASLRRSLRPDFLWRRPEGCPDPLPLYLLQAGDVQKAARTIACHQEIASGGVFAVAMLTAFDAAIAVGGAAMYRRLFWETGLIGQVLYLEAEAAGIRATGIGCFFDDALHELAGIAETSWQSLYHFTLGGALEDPRLETAEAYAHLSGEA